VRRRGGHIVDDFTVTDVRDLGKAGVSVVSRSGEELRAEAVVLASGAWLTSLARGFGVRQVVQAGRGYSFSVRPEPMPQHPIYLPAERLACNPLGDRSRVTGTRELGSADAPADRRRIETVVQAARPMFAEVEWGERRDERV